MSLPEVDKRGWPEGPWHEEPDYARFEAHGLLCEVERYPSTGHLCGYVTCEHSVGEAKLPEGITWGGNQRYGFDCHHVGQYAPGDDTHGPEDYCTFDEVCERTTALAKEIRKRTVWWRRLLRALARWANATADGR